VDRGDPVDGDLLDGELRCVTCRERYPVVQGVGILVPQGYRHVANETSEEQELLQLLVPHLLAHYGDLIEGNQRNSFTDSTFWRDLGALEASGVAVDLDASVGRAALGLSRSADLVLACEPSYVTARFARSMVRQGRTTVRLVDEGTFGEDFEVDVSPLLGGDVEFIVADPNRPPVAPQRANFVLAANLLERQPDPEGFLDRCNDILARDGRLALASPWSWWKQRKTEVTWPEPGVRTADAVLERLAGHDVVERRDLHLVLRDHARLEQVLRPELLVTRKG
jgi:SAM-dependent methyltransferase